MKGRGAGEWLQQPVVWLGAAILAATIAACVVTIVLAVRHADTPLEATDRSVLKVPLRSPADTPPRPQERR